jgi:Ca2+-binding RTX toxin-like protein
VHTLCLRPPSLAVIALAGILVPALVLADLVIGTSDPDVLEGTPEADTLDGKGGADTMMGLGGNDTYLVNQADDVVIEGAGEGTDTVRSLVTYTLPIFVENLVLTGVAPANGKGNSLDNKLIGNGAKNVLNGLGGNDRLIGKEGSDVYIVNASGDRVVEGVGQGSDTVQSSVTHSLQANVERLVLTGAAAINGSGNELNNSMTGNPQANVLSGKEGRDTLNGKDGDDRLLGGDGKDTLTGGPGLDTFVFDVAPNELTNLDAVTDFNPPEDVIRLVGAAFPALSTAGTLPATAFRAAPAAASSSDRILYDPGTGALRYDADGTGATVAVQFATLAPGLAVSNADFFVVDPVAPPPVDYATQIQPIFTGNCQSCHSGASAPQGLRLDANNSFANLVNVNSRQVPSLKRVKPSDPDNSYLVHKIEGTAAVGVRMPAGRPPLSSTDISRIRQWISEGAEP